MLQSYYIAMFRVTSAVDINVQEVNSKMSSLHFCMVTKNINWFVLKRRISS